MKNIIAASAISFLILFSANSFALSKAAQKCDINIKDQKFASGILKKIDGEGCKFQLESGKRNRLIICNLDKTPAEIESHDLKIEKIIKGGSSAKIRIRPLVKGKIYKFEEEFSEYECYFEGR